MSALLLINIFIVYIFTCKGIKFLDVYDASYNKIIPDKSVICL